MTPNDRISHFMTRSPHTIGVDRTLAQAHRVMREHRIRHLPVMAGGKLIGIVSERDLHLLETLKDTDPLQATVEEAMSTDVFAVHPNARLTAVAANPVLGIFTALDGLRVLASFTGERNSAHPVGVKG